MELYCNSDCWEFVLRLRSEMLAIESHKNKMEKVLPELLSKIENRNKAGWNRHNYYIEVGIEGVNEWHFKELEFLKGLVDAPIEGIKKTMEVNTRIRDEHLLFLERKRGSYDKYEYYKDTFNRGLNRSNLHRNM